MNKLKSGIIAGAILLTGGGTVLAFNIPWNNSTPQSRYDMEVEQYQSVLQGVKIARQQLLQAQGDLAYQKAEQASQEHNMEELLRLTSVIDKVTKEKDEIASGRLVFRWEQFTK